MIFSGRVIGSGSINRYTLNNPVLFLTTDFHCLLLPGFIFPPE
jgi:hypothetical protein